MEAVLYGRFFAVEDWYWWSVGTRAIFRDWVADALRGSTAPVLLDLGCGTGAFTAELGAMGQVTGLDLSREALLFSRQRGLDRLCLGTAEALPFGAQRFDAVTAVDVIEHADDRQIVHEIARVLKPGGAALIHVPAFPFLWGEHDEVNRHRRRYRRSELASVVESNELQIERMSYINCLLFPLVLPARLGKRAMRRLKPKAAPEAEIYDLPKWANRGLTRLLGWERTILRWSNLPIGVSLVCLARK